jgi:beta-phosphoglucomutase
MRKAGKQESCFLISCLPAFLIVFGLVVRSFEGGAMHAALWDMDGTLVDTAELHFAAWQEMGKQLGKPFSRADFTATFGKRNPEILQQIYGDRFNAKEIDDLGTKKEELYKAAARKQGVELLPGARALLEGLKAAGFRQAIGSSAPRGNVDLILQLTGTSALFDAVVSSEDTERGKPDPQVFLVAAERVRVPPRGCVVFEDAPAGVQAAKAAGMKCVAVRFIDHHSEATLRASGATVIVASLAALAVHDITHLLTETPA